MSESLTHRAARLAREIRRDPARIEEWSYPPKMELGSSCCCHICVDDPNFDDDCVAFCIMTAARKEHRRCLELALMLAGASLTQRRRINHLAWRWTPPDMEPWD